MGTDAGVTLHGVQFVLFSKEGCSYLKGSGHQTSQAVSGCFRVHVAGALKCELCGSQVWMGC